MNFAYFNPKYDGGDDVPVYGDGQQQRDWLWVEDFCAAVYTLVRAESILHSTYNIAAQNHRRNADVARQINKLCTGRSDQLRFVEDRPGHDRRYALDDRRFRTEFGWEPTKSWNEGLRETVRWYQQHSKWVARRKRKGYRDYYRQMYHWRLNG